MADRYLDYLLAQQASPSALSSPSFIGSFMGKLQQQMTSPRTSAVRCFYSIKALCC